MRKRLVLALLLLLPSIALADAIDSAEAKRRGVSVETVALERAKQQIQNLQTQLADAHAKIKTLQDEKSQAEKRTAEAEAALAKLKSDMTPAQKTALDARARIEQAIKDKSVVAGMTVAEVDSVVGVKGVMKSQNERNEVYVWTVTKKIMVQPRESPRHSGEVRFKSSIPPVPKMSEEEVVDYTIVANVSGGKVSSFERVMGTD